MKKIIILIELAVIFLTYFGAALANVVVREIMSDYYPFYLIMLYSVLYIFSAAILYFLCRSSKKKLVFYLCLFNLFLLPFLVKYSEGVLYLEGNRIGICEPLIISGYPFGAGCRTCFIKNEQGKWSFTGECWVE